MITEAQFEEYDRGIAVLAAAMRYKLRRGVHRNSLAEATTGRLIEGLCRESHELVEAIAKHDRDAIVLECADCANFLLGFVIKVMEGKQIDGFRERMEGFGVSTPVVDHPDAAPTVSGGA